MVCLDQSKPKIYFCYKAINGKLVPAVANFPDAKDHEERVLKLLDMFKDSATPVVEVLDSSTPLAVLALVSRFEAQLLKTRKSQRGMRHNIGWVIKNLKEEIK